MSENNKKNETNEQDSSFCSEISEQTSEIKPEEKAEEKTVEKAEKKPEEKIEKKAEKRTEMKTENKTKTKANSRTVKVAKTETAARDPRIRPRTVKRKNKKLSKASAILITILIAVAFIAVVLAISIIANTSGKPTGMLLSYTCEAGEHVSASVYAPSSDYEAKFPDIYDIDALTHMVGTHKIQVNLNGIGYDVTLVVKDTKAPVGKGLNYVCQLGTEFDPADMVTEIIDETKVTVSFKNAPNMSVEGRQSVRLKLTDEGGNISYIDDCFVFVAKNMNVKSWEMGTRYPSATDLCNGNADIVYQNVNDLSEITTPGRHNIPMKITISGASDTYYVPLECVDTVPPQVTIKDGNVYKIGEKFPEASFWIAECTDGTPVKYYYAYDYTITTPDVYNIEVIAEDAAGNKTAVTVKLTAYDGKDDIFAPIISLKKEILISVGGELVLSDYVSIFDDKDGDISLDDRKKVVIEYPENLDLNSPGKYTIIISATDSSGKSAVTPITVKVIHPSVNKEAADSLADDILSSIIKTGMSTEQKVYAVFEYIAKKKNMDFTGNSDKNNDPWREFYAGITLSYGDSYTSACMMKTLLDRLDIDCMIINNLSATTYWTLVDYGDGWYHVDPFLHRTSWIVNGATIETVKITDDQMDDFNRFMNNNSAERDSYAFNTALYPATPIYSQDTGEYKYLPYKVSYLSSIGGYIEGEAEQKVSHLQSSSAVKAIPSKGYRFVSWSDGVTTQQRSDIVKTNLTVTAQFVESEGLFKTYILSYMAGEGGKIDGVDFQIVDVGHYGTTVSAIPNEGYQFIGWSDGVTTPSRTDLGTNDVDVTAKFIPTLENLFTLEYRTTEGGTISGSTFQVLDNGSGGSEVMAVPDEGYIFNMWSDGKLNPVRKDPYGANLTVTAKFVKADAVLVELNYKAQSGGSIEGLTYQRIEKGSYGDLVTAVPDIGYYFVAWSDGLADAERRDFTSESKEVSAIFAKLDRYRVIYLISGSGGYINGESTQRVYAGDSTSEVTAVPFPGYIFKGWSDGVKFETRTDKPDKDFEVTALFEELPKYTVTYSANEGGSIKGESVQTVHSTTASQTVTAVPERGYKFVSWSDGNKSAERSDIVSDRNLEFTASFEKVELYTAHYSAGSNGKVVGTLTQTAYEGEYFTTVTAVPDNGFEFASWSDGVTTASRTDLVTGDLSVTATFVASKVCTVYYSSSIGGTIKGETTQNVLLNHNTSSVTAVADEGYVFVKWSDGVTTATRSDKATKDTVFYTAIFEPVKES